jgi:copper chaperone CopZ
MDGKDIEKKLEEIDALKTEFNDLKNSITKIEGIVDTIQTSVAPAIDFVVKQNETIRNGKIEKILELRTLV